jgi:hypothetical protein
MKSMSSSYMSGVSDTCDYSEALEISFLQFILFIGWIEITEKHSVLFCLIAE